MSQAQARGKKGVAASLLYEAKWGGNHQSSIDE